MLFKNKLLHILILTFFISTQLISSEVTFTDELLSSWTTKTDFTALYILLGIFSIIIFMALIFYLNIKEENKKKIEAQQRMLEQQSKMASMGEMLDAIAHQWKQPLNALTMYLDIMKSDSEEGIVDKAYIKNIEDGMHAQITHMTTTLNEFRNFFRPNTNINNFNILDALNSVLLLTKDEFLKNMICIEIDIDAEITLKGNENEFKHLILNLINNSKDAFNEKEMLNRHIFIKAYENQQTIYIQLQDDAGGIPKDAMKEIFEANFTTKKLGKGTGIGLYMSSQIVKKMNGQIDVKNVDDGACFYINFDTIKK